jgi:putative ABC transport system substrate-binding protein
VRQVRISKFIVRIGLAAIWVVVLAFALLATPCAAEAQHPTKIPRIGYLSPRAGPSFYDRAFLKGLRDLGYIEGQNIVIEYRWADWASDRLAAFAADLVQLKADLIVSTGGSAPAVAVKQATAAIPIVFVAGDPVGYGLVSSLSRPGGNVTGVNILTAELNAKRLDLLKEALPGASRVGILANPEPPAYRVARRNLEGAARSLGMRLYIRDVEAPDDLDRAFADMRKERVDALLVMNDPLLFAQRGRIAGLATKSYLPGIYEWREFSEVGGLMSYGADLAELYRRAASYVDKILKGAKPADLPIEQPTKFELVVNLKTAKALGLTVPQSILIRADEVIQ